MCLATPPLPAIQPEPASSATVTSTLSPQGSDTEPPEPSGDTTVSLAAGNRPPEATDSPHLAEESPDRAASDMPASTPFEPDTSPAMRIVVALALVVAAVCIAAIACRSCRAGKDGMSA